MLHYFTNSQPFNEKYTKSGKSRCCNGTFAIYIAASKKCLTKRQIIFRFVNSAFPQLYCLKFSFKSVDIKVCYVRKLSGCFAARCYESAADGGAENAGPENAGPPVNTVNR